MRLRQLLLSAIQKKREDRGARVLIIFILQIIPCMMPQGLVIREDDPLLGEVL
jgi:hypothetical protein